MTYTIQTDIAHTTTKSEIKQFAFEHNCTLSKFQKNGPAGGNPLYLFSAKNKSDLQKLTENIYGA